MEQNEVLIKSKERVKKHAEVYTPNWLVNKMCDMLQENSKDDDVFAIEKTFLEPSCGNGNFLAVILERKLKNCHSNSDIRVAVESIYGIDIQADNVEEAKQRMQAMLPIDCMDILNKNIVVGNFLEPENIWFLADQAECLHQTALKECDKRKRRKQK